MMKCHYISLVCLTLVVTITADENKNETCKLYPLDKLKRSLLCDYDTTIRPSQHNVTVVRINSDFLFITLNESAGTMLLTGNLGMVWTDLRLRWNYTEHEDIDQIVVGVQEIWHPDIHILNGATNDETTNGYFPCIVFHTGKVICASHFSVNVLCNLEFYHWPFDSQECQLIFGAWTDKELDLHFYGHSPTENSTLVYMDWHVTEIRHVRREKEYKILGFTTAELNYIITLKRYSPTYYYVIIAPAFAVVLLTLVGFWLPLVAREKVILNVYTIIMLCLFILYFFRGISSVVSSTPLIVSFYIGSLCVVSLSLVISVGIINLAQQRDSVKLPVRIFHMFEKLQRALCLKLLFFGAGQSKQDEIESQKMSWIKVATFLNSFLFLLYCFIFSILITSCILRIIY